MISSDLPEILGMSDRIVVMREGRTVGQLSRAEATAERVMALAAARMTLRRALSRYAIFVALALECLIVGLTTDTFFTPGNLSNVLRQNAFIAILAAGMTFVILTGGIDLSVGSVVGLSGVVCADLLARGIDVVPAIAAGLGIGLGVGLVNGAAVTTLRIPAFVVTLAMMLVVRGAAFKYTDARTITGLPPSFATLSGGVAAATIMAGRVRRRPGLS